VPACRSRESSHGVAGVGGVGASGSLISGSLVGLSVNRRVEHAQLVCVARIAQHIAVRFERNPAACARRMMTRGLCDAAFRCHAPRIRLRDVVIPQLAAGLSDRTALRTCARPRP